MAGSQPTQHDGVFTRLVSVGHAGAPALPPPAAPAEPGAPPVMVPTPAAPATLAPPPRAVAPPATPTPAAPPFALGEPAALPPAIALPPAFPVPGVPAPPFETGLSVEEQPAAIAKATPPATQPRSAR